MAYDELGVRRTPYKITQPSGQQLNPPDLIREFKALNGLTSKEFAKELYVSIGAVNQWLSGKRKVPGPVIAYMKRVGTKH